MAASGAGGCGCLREPREKRGGQELHDPQTRGGGRVSLLLAMAAQTLGQPGAGGGVEAVLRTPLPWPQGESHVCGHFPRRR